MKKGVFPFELDVDVDFCSVKDVVELERMADVVELERMADVVELERMADVVELERMADVVELERMADVVELESVVLVPTGELVLPSNWISMALERITIAMTRITRVDRFLAELITTYFLPFSSQVLSQAAKRLSSLGSSCPQSSRSR
jgi:hypothetical protein